MPFSNRIVKKKNAIIRFAGDSGDGIQLIGDQFSLTAALFGNDLATFSDFPAEIRAPAGTLEGVSGYQVQIGKNPIYTPGDQADVLVALNPAALKSNIHHVRSSGIVIINTDSFEKNNLAKAGFESNPIEDDDSMAGFHIVKAPISSLTKKLLKETTITTKDALRCKNMFALGMVYWLFDRSLEVTQNFINKKFKNVSAIAHANIKALHAGYHFAETIEALPSAYTIASAKLEKGTYRHISGNIALAWGLMTATERIDKKLFFGSYPITPASSILHELSRYKHMHVSVFQAEDEIAAACFAIGASYAGQLGVTASSGPGIVLKGEAMGLAIMAEIPLVVIDVQRGGPSTGLPTKTEQSDMNLALYGRHGESPAIVLAASTPSDCFYFSYMAVKLTVEHMTPVILLSDAVLANGSEPWKIPEIRDMPAITIPHSNSDNEAGTHNPYSRDETTLARYWATPGMPGKEHRIGGIEKQALTGNISYDPKNHEQMVNIRKKKVSLVATHIPLLNVKKKGKKLLAIGWGSTYGSLQTAVITLQQQGKEISHAHFNYINPLPRNTEEVLLDFETIVVCELNTGQFAAYLRSTFPASTILSYNKVQGIPFTVSELKNYFLPLL